MQNMCQPGFYCPAGSSAMIPCDQGSYCSGYALSAVSGTCEQGYICKKKATKPNPDDGGITGLQCPLGYYCPAGACTYQSTDSICTVFQTPCPKGTYNDKTGTFDQTYCLACPPNRICPDLATTEPTVKCDAGFYCQTVNGVFTQFPCQVGYACPANQLAQQVCTSGSY